jgi:hypothetical protein
MGGSALAIASNNNLVAETVLSCSTSRRLHSADEAPLSYMCKDLVVALMDKL